jgi:hypothetical protein
VLSAVAIAAVVVLVALIARELGAARAGQAVAAVSTAASGAAMAVGHLLSTTTFDILAWVAIVYLVVRILGGGDQRQWLLVGLVAGTALENKQTVLLLVAALAVGCLLDRRWDVPRSSWLWAGVVITVALWLPNLIWQAKHGWPQLELAHEISDEDPVANRVELLPLQLLLIGPLLAPLWIGGLWWLLRRAEARPYRPLGYSYLALLAIVLAIGAKPYYTMGLLLALLGAGGVVAEGWLRSKPVRHFTLGAAVAVSGAVAAILTLPLVPAQNVHATPIPDVNEDAIETIGWPVFARTVGEVWIRLPRAEQAHAVVFASNYGEAGAIARFGPEYGIPRAYSGHNAYWRFGRPPDGARPIIVVGYHRLGSLRRIFAGCVLSARIDNGVALDNEEQGAPIWTCSRTVRAWSTLWPELHSLNA